MRMAAVSAYAHRALQCFSAVAAVFGTVVLLPASICAPCVSLLFRYSSGGSLTHPTFSFDCGGNFRDLSSRLPTLRSTPLFPADFRDLHDLSPLDDFVANERGKRGGCARSRLDVLRNERVPYFSYVQDRGDFAIQ